MKTITISYDEKHKIVNVCDTDAPDCISFSYNEKFEIEQELPDSDCEDFNDNARWITKTLLEILKMEHEDPNAHCDWTADNDVNSATGRYKFNVSITKAED